jgi:hypothetical protein
MLTRPAHASHDDERRPGKAADASPRLSPTRSHTPPSLLRGDSISLDIFMARLRLEEFKALRQHMSRVVSV